MTADRAGAHPLNYGDCTVLTELRHLTAGRGPDHCTEAVRMEAHTDITALQAYDKTKQLLRLQTERLFRSAGGDPRLRQRRHGVDARRLRRARRHAPDRVAHEPVQHRQSGQKP